MTKSYDEPSVYELFEQVKSHPDYVFGTIFTTDDFETPEQLAVARKNAEAAVEQMCEEGFAVATEDWEIS